MPIARCVVCLFPVSIIVLGASFAFGQNYPNKSIRIVTSEPGGGGDFAARLIAQGITGPMGQQVIVDNRGGGGIIQGQLVSKSPPDGYTLLSTSGNFWIGPLLQETPYDPVRDFSPISLTNTAPNVVVVHPSLPVKSIKALIALAKARPGELNYGSSTSGTASHLAGELFKSMAGVNIVRIPYKGGGLTVTALIGGEVQLSFSSASAAALHVKSGRLRALAVTSAEPSELLPGLPTVAASGVPGYEMAAVYGMFAPAKTPATIINRLHQEIVRVLNTADVKEKFLKSGVEVVGNSPEQFATMVKFEMARLGKVIKDAGIRAE